MKGGKAFRARAPQGAGVTCRAGACQSQLGPCGKHQQTFKSWETKSLIDVLGLGSGHSEVVAANFTKEAGQLPVALKIDGHFIATWKTCFVQVSMAVTAITADFLDRNRNRRTMQLQMVKAEQMAISGHLTAGQLAACPSDFLCPISLEIMYSPVYLVSTGQTYDLISLHTWLSSGGTSCPLTGLQLQGTVVLRLDEERRTQIYAWLAEQGVDVAHIIMEVAQKWHAQGSDGDMIADSGNGTKNFGRRLLGGVCSVLQFFGGQSKIYGSIY